MAREDEEDEEKVQKLKVSNQALGTVQSQPEGYTLDSPTRITACHQFILNVLSLVNLALRS